jgi:hypothetical protein
MHSASNIASLLINTPDLIANPFPAALLDVLAGYNYLVNDVGFSPSDIYSVETRLAET